jgi:hypothetical protein
MSTNPDASVDPVEGMAHSKVDVLIIGAGPAGAMVRPESPPPECICSNMCTADGQLALPLQFVRHQVRGPLSPSPPYELLRRISTRIIDRRPTKLVHGQADGLMARSLEMFESIGIFQDVQKETSDISEIRLWNPDPETGRLRRTSVMPQDKPGDSRFVVCILHQGRVEHYLNENTFTNSNGRLIVERGAVPESLDIDRSAVGGTRNRILSPFACDT